MWNTFHSGATKTHERFSLKPSTRWDRKNITTIFENITQLYKYIQIYTNIYQHIINSQKFNQHLLEII